MSSPTPARPPAAVHSSARRRPAATAPRTERALRAALLPAPAPVSRAAWVLPWLIVLVGAVLRFWHLGTPHAIAFDETYYVKDAWALAQSGYERAWPQGADDAFAAGAPPEPSPQASFVVHPPLGKWLIAAGMLLLGPEDPAGWRLASAVAGSLMLVLVVVAARLLFRSPAAAALAAAGLSLDGLHLTHSRLALLDVFLALFVLAAFVALLLDQRQARLRLARRLGAALSAQPAERSASASDPLRWGPRLGVRWWRILAGVLCGAALGVKWNALFFIAALGLLSVAWDAAARRRAGIRRWWASALLRDAPPAALSVLGAAAVAYLSTWTGWLVTSGGYDRDWAARHPGEGALWLPPALRSLWAYHQAAYAFHTGLDSGHTYASQPWQWAVLARPTSYFYETPAGCHAASCSQQILNQGNPALWWTALPALLAAVLLVALRRRWALAGPLVLVAVGWAPWLMYPERTKYFFYTLPYLPFLVLVVAGVLALAPGRPGDSRARRWAGTAVVSLWVGALVGCAVFFWPIWTAQVIPYDAWHARMWFPSWI